MCFSLTRRRDFSVRPPPSVNEVQVLSVGTWQKWNEGQRTNKQKSGGTKIVIVNFNDLIVNRSLKL